MSREEWFSIIPRRGGRSENNSGIFKCERPPRRQASASEHYDVLDAQLARNLYHPDDHPEIVRGDAEFLRLLEAGGDVWIDPNHPRPRFIKAMDKRKFRPRDLNEVLKQMIEWVESYACRWMKKWGLQQAREDRIGDVVSYVVHQLLGILRTKKNHRQPVQNKENNEFIQVLKDIDVLLDIAGEKTRASRICVNSIACSPLKKQLKEILKIWNDIKALDMEIDYLGVVMSAPCKNNADLERKLPKARLVRYNIMRQGIADKGLSLEDEIQKNNKQKSVKVELRKVEEGIKFYKMLIEQWNLKQVRILEAMDRQVQEGEKTKGNFDVPEVTELNDSKDCEVADGGSPLEMLADVAAQAEPLEDINTISLDMATVVSNSLPALPQGWSADKDFKPIGKLSPATQRSIEPVGPHFLAHARRARHKRTFSEDDRIQAQENVKKVEEEDDGEISEPEDPMMLSRDAKDWKGQDHYAVLGLSKYRYKATEDQIKRAHRKKVLRHHPDKKAAAGSSEDDSFFKCIQKAHETLTDPVKRRQFDSVDEHADVEPPSKKVAKGTKFYSLWSKVFESEGRFSKNQPVPKFGKIDSTQEEVEAFYNFFYTFDSWRSFEYQDEDVPDDNEGRDQKRHTERKNNNARKKKKTEDSARLRKLVEDAQAGDERIARFRQEANAAKNKKKLDKEAREKKAAEEAQVKKDAEAQAKKDAEEKAKADKEGNKKAREAAKAAVKKNRRVLKGSVKDANYFVKGDADAAAIDSVLNEVEVVQGKVDPDEIAALAGKLNGLKVADEIKSVWADEVKRLVAAGKVKDGELKSLA